MSRRLVDGKKPSKPKPGSNPGGVPSLLEINPDLAKKILNSIRMGNYIAVAARQYGINPISIQRWIAKGLENPSSLYGAFSQQLDQALAEAEARDLASIDSHANGRPAVYKEEPALDKKGQPILVEGKPLMKLARDKDGKPILIQSEIKSDWKAALAKLERRNKKRWGLSDLAQSAAEQEMPLPPTRDVTPEQKSSALNEVRSVIEALDELEADK